MMESVGICPVEIIPLSPLAGKKQNLPLRGEFKEIIQSRRHALIVKIYQCVVQKNGHLILRGKDHLADGQPYRQIQLILRPLAQLVRLVGQKLSRLLGGGGHGAVQNHFIITPAGEVCKDGSGALPQGGGKSGLESGVGQRQNLHGQGDGVILPLENGLPLLQLLQTEAKLPRIAEGLDAAQGGVKVPAEGVILGLEAGLPPPQLLTGCGGPLGGHRGNGGRAVPQGLPAVAGLLLLMDGQVQLAPHLKGQIQGLTGLRQVADHGTEGAELGEDGVQVGAGAGGYRLPGGLSGLLLGSLRLVEGGVFGNGLLPLLLQSSPGRLPLLPPPADREKEQGRNRRQKQKPQNAGGDGGRQETEYKIEDGGSSEKKAAGEAGRAQRGMAGLGPASRGAEAASAGVRPAKGWAFRAFSA